MRQYFVILKQYFKEKPSLDDYIAAHEPKNTEYVEFLIKQYDRMTHNKNFWGESF